MAMTNIAEALNNVPDPATRDALFRAFAALKEVFDAHTHQCAAADAYSSQPATNAAGKTGGTRATFPA
jgi:hypothetical protein